MKIRASLDVDGTWEVEMGVSVRLLGSVEVLRDDARVDLHGRRQRALVAYLALEPRRVRNLDGIIDALWSPDELPADPRQAVHTYASRVRSAVGENIVVSRGGGYELEVSVLAVDAARFESLARSARGPGYSIERRIGLLTEALDLWHGRALDGFHDAEWARADAVRLEELRAQAEDDRGEALLEAGPSSEVVAFLEAAATRSPLRERTHALLMTALDRSGRQAEALRVFHGFRRRLGTDLGLEPSGDISRLEQAIAAGRASSQVEAQVSGRSIGGYVLQEHIGEGAFAVVYRATQASVQRDVAVKVIRAELTNRPEFIRRFEAEAQLVAHLEHPHIVPLYDYWREPGFACLVMRLFPEGTLEDRLQGAPISLDTVVRMVTQVGSALAASHHAGVVHRDVKPANIFVDGAGNFFLGDFGIAYETAVPPASLDSLSIGSPAYAAPEQLRREAVGEAADVHGLAIAVFECLTGHLPFHEARTQAELLHHQLHDPIPQVAASLPGLPGEVDRILARATTKNPAGRYVTIGEFVTAFVDAASGTSPLPERRLGTSTIMSESKNPYKGLLAFQEADAADFFGRRRLIERLIAQLTRAEGPGRVITVIGPSGAGKSSLVRAGLLPELRAGAIPGSGDWYMTSMVPGAHPFEELESALSRIATSPVTGMAELMASDTRGIARAVKQVVPSETGVVLLVMDQFEELFTLCPDEDVRQKFISGLAGALTDPRSRLRAVITLRADFYDRPLRYPAIAALIEQSTVVVTPLAPDELDQSITEPATRAGIGFEPGLVAHMIADVVDQPGALPLLQYILTELFDRQVSGLMTAAAYEELGGLTGALSRRAEQLYLSAGDREQRAIRLVMTRLVTLGEGSEDTRRRARRSELSSDAETSQVIESFGRARLLSFDRDPTDRGQTVEVAHEALIRQWSRLREWVSDDRAGLRIHRQLTAAAASWELGGCDPGELFRGARLTTTDEWVTAHRDELNDAERDFYEASVTARDADVAKERRSTRRLRRSLAAVAVVAVAALVAGGLALHQQHVARGAERRALDDRQAAQASATAAEAAATEADRQRAAATDALAESDNERMASVAPNLVETNFSAALLLATETAQRDTGVTGVGALERVLVAADSRLGFLASNERIRALRFDDQQRVIGFGDTAIHIWDLKTHEELATIPVTGATQQFDVGFEQVRVAFGGEWVGWTTNDHFVHLVDLNHPDHIVDLGHGKGLAINTAGTRVAVGDELGRVDLYTLPELNRLWTWAGDGFATLDEMLAAYGLPKMALANRELPSSLSFSTDGTTLYLGRDHSLAAFDVESGNQTAFSIPNGPDDPGWTDIVANNIVQWPDGSGRFIIHGGVITALIDGPGLKQASQFAVQPLDLSDFVQGSTPLAGDQIAILRSSGKVLIVDARTGETLNSATDAETGQSSAIAASADSRILAVGGSTGVSLLNLDGSGLSHSAIPRPADHLFASGGPDGSWISTELSFYGAGTGDSAGRFYRCTAPGACAEQTLPAVSEALSQADNVRPDLVTIYRDPGTNGANSTLELVDPTTGNRVSAVIDLGGLGETGQAVDPQMRWIATTSIFPYSIHITDLHSGELLAVFPDTGPVQFAVPPSGDMILAFGNASGNSTKIDTTTWERTPSGIPNGEALMGTFSPDGRWLLTVGAGGSLALRDANSWKIVHQLQTDGSLGNSGAFQQAGFSDDGRYVLTSFDGSLRLWSTKDGAPIGDPIGSLSGSTLAALPGQAPIGLSFTDKWVQIWRFDVDAWQATACRAAGRNLTRDEWTRYGPKDSPYHATCPQWPTPQAQ